MKNLFKIVLVSSLTLLCFSCYYDEFPEEEDEFILDPEVEVSFENDIMTIFELRNCAQCHKPSGQNPDLTQGNAYSSLVPNYVTPFDSGNSDLYTKLLGGHRDNVSIEDLAWIEAWIDEGAKDN